MNPPCCENGGTGRIRTSNARQGRRGYSPVGRPVAPTIPQNLERAKRFGLSHSTWKDEVLPLHHTRSKLGAVSVNRTLACALRKRRTATIRTRLRKIRGTGIQPSLHFLLTRERTNPFLGIS